MADSEISIITNNDPSQIHLIAAEQPHPTATDCKAGAVVDSPFIKLEMAGTSLAQLDEHRGSL